MHIHGDRKKLLSRLIVCVKKSEVIIKRKERGERKYESNEWRCYRKWNPMMVFASKYECREEVQAMTSPADCHMHNFQLHQQWAIEHLMRKSFLRSQPRHIPYVWALKPCPRVCEERSGKKNPQLTFGVEREVSREIWCRFAPHLVIIRRVFHIRE